MGGIGEERDGYRELCAMGPKNFVKYILTIRILYFNIR
jgi:hypothetical protein